MNNIKKIKLIVLLLVLALPLVAAPHSTLTIKESSKALAHIFNEVYDEFDDQIERAIISGEGITIKLDSMTALDDDLLFQGTLSIIPLAESTISFSLNGIASLYHDHHHFNNTIVALSGNASLHLHKGHLRLKGVAVTNATLSNYPISLKEVAKKLDID